LEVKFLTFDASSLLVRTEAKASPRDNRVVSHQTNGQSIKKDEKTNTTSGPNKFGGRSLARKMGMHTMLSEDKLKGDDTSSSCHHDADMTGIGGSRSKLQVKLNRSCGVSTSMCVSNHDDASL
jgi:hypothetical protein